MTEFFGSGFLFIGFQNTYLSKFGLGIVTSTVLELNIGTFLFVMFNQVLSLMNLKCKISFVEEIFQQSLFNITRLTGHNIWMKVVDDRKCVMQKNVLESRARKNREIVIQKVYKITTRKRKL